MCIRDRCSNGACGSIIMLSKLFVGFKMLRGLGNGALYCFVDFRTFVLDADDVEVSEISDDGDPSAAATSSSLETVLSTFMKLLGRGFGGA